MQKKNCFEDVLLGSYVIVIARGLLEWNGDIEVVMLDIGNR